MKLFYYFCGRKSLKCDGTDPVAHKKRLMLMRVVNNSTSNHIEEVRDLLLSSSEALIASPFISLAAIDKMKNWLTSELHELTLITTLKEKDPDQLKKVPVLMELYRLKKIRGFNLSVKIDNQLHGKVYIGLKDEIYSGALVTSANFTENGLENNHEWGIFINDQKEISNMHQQIVKNASLELTEKDLMKMKQWIDDNSKDEVKSPTIDVSFIDMIELKSASNANVTYWLKPLGKSPNPVPSNRLFGGAEHQITFTKKNPSGVKEGDVLIAYSVVSQQLISVFVAGNERGRLTHFDKPEDEQWPNYIVCRNETPEYGANWPVMKRTLRDLRKEFVKKSSTSITPTGNSINVLQRGSDHIRLTPEFAKFVIEMMKNECQKVNL